MNEDEERQRTRAPLPEPETFDELVMGSELAPYWLDIRNYYPEPHYTLQYRGVPFAPLGDIQAISGQKKNDKTFLEVQLMATLLASGSEMQRAKLPGLEMAEGLADVLGHEPRVLFVDTEQSQLSTAKVVRRVHALCGWDQHRPHPRFNALWLRAVDSRDVALRRWELIEKAVDAVSPDVLFIDGLRDVVHDFNDAAESMTAINRLLMMSSERQMSIWNVVHFNPHAMSDVSDAKMRGHLGTELGNKVSDTLTCAKKRTASGVTFTVHQPDARNKDIPDWTFEIEDPLGIPRIVDADGLQATSTATGNHTAANSLYDIRRWVEKAAKTYDFPMTRRDVKEKVFKLLGKVTNSNIQQADLQLAIDNGLLQESTLKRNGFYLIELGNELPF